VRFEGRVAVDTYQFRDIHLRMTLNVREGVTVVIKWNTEALDYQSANENLDLFGMSNIIMTIAEVEPIPQYIVVNLR